MVLIGGVAPVTQAGEAKAQQVVPIALMEGREGSS